MAALEVSIDDLDLSNDSVEQRLVVMEGVRECGVNDVFDSDAVSPECVDL